MSTRLKLLKPTANISFPPPHIQLHPDDANSKVFLAIAKAFLSVDNRAMTIKDLAERASYHGLCCQNLSAAAQAITTYLRSHKTRCDKQQDQPLLLTHTLSGTPADDDLVPALYSRSGGDSHPAENRLTNFRKGTAVWYLSRATGAECPFARAGIRLCDYILPEEEKPSKRDRFHSAEACGQKRKRPLRGCLTKDSPSGSDNERPPKIKLTLRLKPLLKTNTNPDSPSTSNHRVSSSISSDSDHYSDDDFMSVDEADESAHEDEPTARLPSQEEPWRLPPYPRRSISIPCYTPSADSYYPCYPSPSQYNNNYKDPFRRSPSTFATPPPESDDEEDDFHVAMRNDYSADLFPRSDETGWEADSEGDGETLWESPAPKSPPTSLVPAPNEVTVKEEPRDVQGMLDAWEDYDNSVRVAEFLAKAVLEADPLVKVEAPDHFDLNPVSVNWDEDTSVGVKQEDFDVGSLFPPTPISPISALANQFASFMYTDSSPPADDLSQNKDSTVRPRSKTLPTSTVFCPTPTTSLTAFSISPTLARQSFSAPSTRDVPVQYPSLSTNTSTLNANTPSPIFAPPPTPCVSPLQTRCQPSISAFAGQTKVIVHTCQPCNPPISATQIEDISVYQMILGAFQLLRRIDTDFVNLSPIVAYSGAPPPVLSSIMNATVITKGSPEACGTWVPLSAAQAYVKDHVHAENTGLDLFLSEELVERFPPALQDFRRSNATARALNQFGKHFSSTLQAAQLDVGNDSLWDPRQAWAQNSSDPAPSPSTFPLPVAVTLSERHHAAEKDVPLSQTEEEIFEALCDIPDWTEETPNSDMAVDRVEVGPQPCVEPNPELAAPIIESASAPPPPSGSPSEPQTSAMAATPHKEAMQSPALRRSKRVADALASSRVTRSRKGNSRNSLS